LRRSLPGAAFCRWWRWALLLLWCAVCGCRSTSGELAEELQTAVSWAATAHFVGEAWAAGQVPKAYATHTLQQGQRELHKGHAKISALALLAELRATLLGEVHGLEAVLRDMHTAVQRGDRGALQQQLRVLAQQQQALTALLTAYRGQP